MDVDCVFFGPIRETTGTKEATRSLETGVTVREFIERLDDDYDGLGDRLLTDSGTIPDDINVTVGKRNVRQLDGADTVLSDGDTVRVTTSIQGG